MFGGGHVGKIGFTLIELSIVVVVIGLIAGGVLVGSSLIHAAEIHSVISDVEKFIEVLENYQPQIIPRENFIEKFSRDVIMDKMTDSILSMIPSKKLQLV